MMKKIFAISVMLLIGILAAKAVPLNPEYYWGFVYVEDEPAPDGTNLSVETESGEILASQIIPIDTNFKGSFSIQINFDDSFTSKDEGAEENERIEWKINGLSAIELVNDAAVSGAMNNNFSVKGILNPEIEASVDFEKEILFGDALNLKLTLENKGYGSADAKIRLENFDIHQSIRVEKRSSKEIPIKLNASSCEFNPNTLEIEYFNIAGDKIETLQEDVSFDVRGTDLVVEAVTYDERDYYENEAVRINASVRNTGELAVQTFKIRFFDNEPIFENIIEERNVDIVLLPGDRKDIIILWNPENKSGNHLIYVSVEADYECNPGNNMKKSKILSVKQYIAPIPATGHTVSKPGIVENIPKLGVIIILFVIVLVVLSMAILQNIKVKKKEEDKDIKEEDVEEELERLKGDVGIIEETKEVSVKEKKRKIYIKSFIMENRENLEEILHVIRGKTDMLLVNIEVLRQNRDEFKFCVLQIKKSAEIVKSNIFIFRGKLLVVVPSYMSIQK